MRKTTTMLLRHQWKEEDDDIIRHRYTGTRKSAEYIAYQLQTINGHRITSDSVMERASRLGITIGHSKKMWTQQEENMLNHMILTLPIEVIAKKLKRSTGSVDMKARSLGYKKSIRLDWYTKTEVCTILGVNRASVQKYIDSGELEAYWHGAEKPKQNGGAYWHITKDSMRKFIRRHAGEFVGRNVDLFQIVEIVAGVI
jgi:hypothetical protein